ARRAARQRGIDLREEHERAPELIGTADLVLRQVAFVDHLDGVAKLGRRVGRLGRHGLLRELNVEDGPRDLRRYTFIDLTSLLLRAGRGRQASKQQRGGQRSTQYGHRFSPEDLCSNSN